MSIPAFLPNDHEAVVRKLPVNSESIEFKEWTISYTKSHILKSVCSKGENACPKDAEDEHCELCRYIYALELKHLPDMVFHKNFLSLLHKNGAKIDFNPLDALKRVETGIKSIQVACAEEWRENRLPQHTEQKVKPFDWTFTTDYQGTINDKFQIEETDQQIDRMKLMQKETIIFYLDLTLFEDELHDNGISSCSVKIRVMPSGYFVLLRFFLRVDKVLIKINDTRYHFEIENNFVLKEFTSREAKYEELEKVPPRLFTIPQEIEKFLPIKEMNSQKLIFK